MDVKQLRCKNCEGELDIESAVNGVVTCPYCRCQMILPKSVSSTMAFLQGGEQNLDICHFDDAYIMYQKATAADPSDPEGYFGMALATAKVQYLKDLKPTEGDDKVKYKFQPICYEITDKKFVDDKNYLKAIELATPEQQKIYKAKAEEIDYIRDQFYILKNSGLTYDTFICVKVTAENGNHTEDSIIATKLYHELKNAGYNPFYSEEEIHGQLGADYEARILYALYSSKSMLIVCTNEDYLQTIWVRNEYTRFLHMMEEEEKQNESITIVFKDKPIERLPGVKGKLQGINFYSYDALQQILKFVDKFAEDTHILPDIKRKEYSNKVVQKKTTVKQEIKKRQLNVVEGGVASVSEKARLINAENLLRNRDFTHAIKFCMDLIKEKPNIGRCYWMLFLAEQGCADERELINSSRKITDFVNLERAISTTQDKSERENYYNTLFERVKEQKDLASYEEFIELPESDEEQINILTDLMFEKATTQKDCKIFDCAIRTVKDAKKYIKMNLDFAEKVPIKSSARYYKNVLSVDESNKEALYQNFIISNDLTDEKKLFDFCSQQKNYEVLEKELFSFGYNDVAIYNLKKAALASEDSDKICVFYDFILSMIPKTRNKLFKNYLNDIIERLLKDKEVNYENVAKYNNLLLTLDKFDDNAYFNRCLIEHRINNPLALIDYQDEVLDDPDYVAAINSYTENNPDPEKTNIYFDFYEALKVYSSMLSDKEVKEYVLENYIPERKKMANCKQEINSLLDKHAKELLNETFKEYNVRSIRDLYGLQEDVSTNEKLLLAHKFSSASLNKELTRQIFNAIKNQPESANRNQEKAQNQEKERKRNQKIDRKNRILRLILLILMPISLIASVGMFATLTSQLMFWKKMSYWAFNDPEKYKYFTPVFFFLTIASICLIAYYRRHNYRNLKYRLLIIPLVAIAMTLALTITAGVANKKTYVDENLYVKLEKTEGGYKIIDNHCLNYKNIEFRLPREFNGEEVVAIENLTFDDKNYESCKIIYPSTIKYLERGSFRTVRTFLHLNLYQKNIVDFGEFAKDTKWKLYNDQTKETLILDFKGMSDKGFENCMLNYSWTRVEE